MTRNKALFIIGTLFLILFKLVVIADNQNELIRLNKELVHDNVQIISTLTTIKYNTSKSGG